MAKINNIAICFIVLLMLVTGCTRDNIRLFTEMIHLKKALEKEYKVDDLNLSVWNGNTIAVSFVNSSFNALSETEKQSKAEEIARFVNKHNTTKNIKMISVGFVVYKHYIIFTYTRNTDNFDFRVTQL